MEDYVAGFEDCPQGAVASVKSYLAGEAAAIIVDANVSTWEEIKTVLLEHYVPQGHDRAQQSALSYMKREKGEKASTLSVRVRVTARKAYPKLTRLDRDPLMINSFLKAWGDRDVERTVLANNLTAFDDVVQLAERMTLMGGPPSVATTSTVKRQSGVMRFQDETVDDDVSEGTVFRIAKIFTDQMEDKIDDRFREEDRYRQRRDQSEEGRYRQRRDQSEEGHYRQRRDQSDNRRWSGATRAVSNQREPYPNRGPKEPYRARTPSTGRNRGASRDGSKGRARSVSETRRCYKCQGKGHLLADCPSVNWYKPDGTIDQDKTRIDQKNYQVDPNVKGTPTRPT